jgi:hypothetical protein
MILAHPDELSLQYGWIALPATVYSHKEENKTTLDIHHYSIRIILTLILSVRFLKTPRVKTCTRIFRV